MKSTLSLVVGVALLSGCPKPTSTDTTPTASSSAAANPTTSAITATMTSAIAATPMATGAEVDSCSVVTQAQAGAALGQPVRAPVRGKATVEGGVACVFYGPSVPATANPDVPVANSVRVVLVSGPSATTIFNDYKSKVPAQAIGGLGDQAYYDGSKSLSVLKGSKYLRVAVIGAPDVLGAEKALATAAVLNM